MYFSSDKPVKFIFAPLKLCVSRLAVTIDIFDKFQRSDVNIMLLLSLLNLEQSWRQTGNNLQWLNESRTFILIQTADSVKGFGVTVDGLFRGGACRLALGIGRLSIVEFGAYFIYSLT